MDEAGKDVPLQTDIIKTEISPEASFSQVTSKDRRTATEKRNGAVLFRNLGLIDVRVNTQAFTEFLKLNGLTANQISAIEITFRAGTLADRNFHGITINGWHAGNQIEIYTTLPVSRERVRSVNIPLKPQNLAWCLAHELAHNIQEQTGQGTANTFMTATTMEQVVNDPLERDAGQFARNHWEEILNWIKFREIPGLNFEDNTGQDRVVGELGQSPYSYDLDRRLILVDKDNPALYLEKRIERMISESGQARRIDREQIGAIINQGQKLVETRKLGMAEFNDLIDRLADHFEKRGDKELQEFSLASKYKP